MSNNNYSMTDFFELSLFTGCISLFMTEILLYYSEKLIFFGIERRTDGRKYILYKIKRNN